MKKTRKILLGAVLIIILISNIPIMTFIIDSLMKQDSYAYSNGDGTLTLWCHSFKDKPYPDAMILSTTTVDTTVSHNPNFPLVPIGTRLRQDYPGADTIMYRLFSKNPLKFWHWREYIFGDKKFNFPYQNWDKIKQGRPKKIKLNKQWQMF